jgi:prepilin-type N-terminal cleavage/methylation domain-containing protein
MKLVHRRFMKFDSKVWVQRMERGFSLLEMAITLAILLILMAIASPKVMSHIYAVRIRYSATNLSGLLQQGRIEAVRKNTFYSLQQAALGNAVVELFVDVNKNGTLAASDPQVVMAGQITVSAGAGSGAPGEAGFLASFNFATAAAGVQASFNARGLPCVQVGQTCPQTPGQGFVYFVSGPNGAGGLGWASVVVTPSGRAEVWSYDGANWIQQ